MTGPTIGRLKKLGDEETPQVDISMEASPDENNDTDTLTPPSQQKSTKLRLKSKADLPESDPDAATCPECKKEIQENAVLCVQCGFNLKAGKKEKTKANLSSNPNPYQAPSAQLNRNSASQAQSYYPGIRRGKYWAYSILFNILSTLVTFISPGLAIIASICMIPVSLYLVVQRMRNTGCSGWLAIMIIIPIANIWAAYRLVCCQEGYSDSDGLDGTGKVLVGVFLFLILAGVGLAFMSASMMQNGFQP